MSLSLLLSVYVSFHSVGAIVIGRLNSHNASDIGNASAGVSCTPPAAFFDFIQAGVGGSPSVVATSMSSTLYAADAGPEVHLFAYDCTKKQKLVFLHIPKNAGTTIESIAFEKDVYWGVKVMPGRQKMPDGNMCSRWHVPPHMLYGANPYKNAEIFCVTRDPWKRMVSEYIYDVEHKFMACGGPPHIYNSSGWNNVCAASGLNGFIEKQLASFSVNKYDCDCHLLPQWDFIEDPGGRQVCTHILPIDDLTDKFNALMAEHGFQLRLAPHTKHNTRATCHVLGAQADTNLGGVFSEASKSLMRFVYAKDFTNLGDSLATSA